MSRNTTYEALLRGWLKEHGGVLLKVTLSFARNESEEADLRQEMQLQLWNSLPAFNGEAKPSTWIYRVCLNTALSWRRDTDRREKRLERSVDVTQLSARTRSPADSADQRDILSILYAAIRKLNAFDRALVLLSLDEIAYRDIAEITGITENHVGVALTRARKRLSELLKGVTDELK